MADQAILTNDSGQAFRLWSRPFDMENAAILHIAARTHLDPVNIAAQHAIVPNARLWPDSDIANDPRAGRNKGAFVDLRNLAFEGQDGGTGKSAVSH